MTLSRPKRLWVALAGLVVVVLGGALWAWAAIASNPVKEPVPKVLPEVKVEPPVQTVLDWMHAMNLHDYPLALSHLAPADRPLMFTTKSAFNSTSFDHIKCSLARETPINSEVDCLFTEPPFGWSVDLTRQADGPWLITGYGQG